MPGRSGTVYKNWLAERGKDFRAGVRIATLDPPSRDIRLFAFEGVGVVGGVGRVVVV